MSSYPGLLQINAIQTADSYLIKMQMDMGLVGSGTLSSYMWLTPKKTTSLGWCSGVLPRLGGCGMSEIKFWVLVCSSTPMLPFYGADEGTKIQKMGAADRFCFFPRPFQFFYLIFAPFTVFI